MYSGVIWHNVLNNCGPCPKSGFLVNQIKEPGAGGLLIIEVKTYEEALKIVKEDPMIKNKIVDWKLNEWIDISKE